MATNIEIKAKVTDIEQFRVIAEKLADHKEILVQEDTFFNSQNGRLKLRCFDHGGAELIYYERTDKAGPKESKYWISRTSDPESLLHSLTSALGVIGVVRKTRALYLVGQTRIHLDNVQDLGTFAELEVVMKDDQSNSDGVRIAEDLMKKLNIRDVDLITDAYIDLLVANSE